MPESDIPPAFLQDRTAQVSVKQAAYEGFQQALLSGRLRPGQLVSQREMTGMLGVSVGALRELLPRLEGEGLLTVMPQRGIQITAINLSMIRDAFQLRAAYEREAVIGAVRRMPDEILTGQRRLHLEIMERLAERRIRSGPLRRAEPRFRLSQAARRAHAERVADPGLQRERHPDPPHQPRPHPAHL